MISIRQTTIALSLGLMAQGAAQADDYSKLATDGARFQLLAVPQSAAPLNAVPGSTVSGSGNLRTETGQFGIDLGPLFPGNDGHIRRPESPRDIRGPAPSRIRIQGEGVGVPRCFAESREGTSC